MAAFSSSCTLVIREKRRSQHAISVHEWKYEIECVRERGRENVQEGLLVARHRATDGDAPLGMATLCAHATTA